MLGEEKIWGLVALYLPLKKRLRKTKKTSAYKASFADGLETKGV